MAGEYLTDNVLDFGLDYIATDVGDANLRVDICSAAPTTYAEATATFTLGNDVSVTTTGPANGTTSGRKLTVDATSGTVSGTNTATHWALSKTNATTELLAAGPLSSPQGVTSGNPFTLTAVEMEIPDVLVT
jgi:hypothetical protein